MTFGLDDIVIRRADALEADMQDETVVLSISDSRYYGFSTTSRDIWNRLVEPVQVRTLCHELAERYEAPRATIEADTLRFLGQFGKNGLIVRTTL